MDPHFLFYRIDAADVIVDVGGAWDDVALAHRDELRSTHIRGQWLFRHVTGEATRMFVWTMFDGVRKLQKARKKTYRCDTPQERRLIEMNIKPEPAGGLLVEHRLLSAERRLREVRVEPAKANGAAFVRCSSCNKVRCDESWIEIDDVPAARALDQSQTFMVIYSVCPSCRADVNRYITS